MIWILRIIITGVFIRYIILTLCCELPLSVSDDIREKTIDTLEKESGSLRKAFNESIKSTAVSDLFRHILYIWFLSIISYGIWFNASQVTTEDGNTKIEMKSNR